MAKKNAIAEVIGKTLSAAEAVTETKLTAERTIDVITNEILGLKTDAGNAIIGIGQRLIEAKELLPHGEWLPWLNDQVEFSERTAQEFMRISREWSNPRTLADLGKSKVLKLLLLPPAEREEFMDAHDVPNMSTRELEDAIRERDKALKDAEMAQAEVKLALVEKSEAQTETLRTKKALEDANARIKALESAPKDVFQDESAIKKAADDARAAAEAEWRAKVKAVEDKFAKIVATAKKKVEQSENADAQSDAKISGLQAEADRLRKELEAAKREQTNAAISGDADLAAFQLLFEQVQTDVNKMRGLLMKVRGREDAALGKKLTEALLALADKVKECAK